MKKGIFGATFVHVLLLSTAAFSNDISKYEKIDGDPARQANRSGFYMGVSIGYVSLSGDFSGVSSSVFEPNSFSGTSNSNAGAYIGGRFGFDWQTNKLIIGLGVDIRSVFGQSPNDNAGLVIITHNDIVSAPEGANGSIGYNIDGIVLFPLKIGSIYDNDITLYALGGLSFASVQIHNELDVRVNNQNRWVPGYTVGAGISKAISETTSVYLEANFHEFEEIADAPGPGVKFTTNPSLFTLGFGMNYRF